MCAFKFGGGGGGGRGGGGEPSFMPGSSRRGGGFISTLRLTEEDRRVLAYTVTDEELLTRFLIVGTEQGTYYASSQEVIAENVECIKRLIADGHGQRVVEKVVELITQGRCVRINTALMVLAFCCRSQDEKTKMAAYKSVVEVCTIPTHLFKFINFLKAYREKKTPGWGRALRNAVGMWYNQFASDPRRLAMLVTKYRYREGWSHADILRLCHVKPACREIGFILRYVAKGLKEAKKFYMEDGAAEAQGSQLESLAKYLAAVEEAKCLRAPKTSGEKEKGEKKEGEKEGVSTEPMEAESDEGNDKEKKKEQKTESIEPMDGVAELQAFKQSDEGSDKITENGQQEEKETWPMEGAEKVNGTQSDKDSDNNDDENKDGEKEGEKTNKAPEPIDDSGLKRAVALVEQFDLVREHMPTPMLNFAMVWQSLLGKMPLTALLRSLNKLSMVGVLDRPDNVATVLQKLCNTEALRKAKVHPIAMLTTWLTYRHGRGLKGNLKWTPIPQVYEALEKAFYASFKNVQPTNKRILIALDVSASMSWGRCLGGNLTPCVASVAMALVTLHAETNVEVVAFSTELLPVQINKTTTLDEALTTTDNMSAGGTDCAMPMLWAKEKNKKFDAFIVYTDCETWGSVMLPADALRQYREASGIKTARMAVVAMERSTYTLADPLDTNMMDISGFDMETPTLLHEFIAGTLCE